MLYNWMHFRSLNPPRDYTAATRESIQHLLDQWLILTWKERAAWLNGLLLWQLISQLLQRPTPDVSPGPNPLVMYISTNPLSCCDTQILSWWSSAQLRCLESWPHVLLSSPVARQWQECVSWTYLWSVLIPFLHLKTAASACHGVTWVLYQIRTLHRPRKQKA